MPMEQEVIPLLVAGVCVVMFLSFFIVIGQWVVTKNSAYGWITAHLVVLSLSIYRWIYLLSGPDWSQGAMVSENNSLVIGGAAVLWAISMGLLMVGVYKLGARK